MDNVIRRFGMVLRKKFPPSKPTSIRMADIHDWAAVTCTQKRNTILLNRKQSAKLACESLVHEYAHILDDTPWNFREEHRNSWGEWYSKLWRLWLKFAEENYDDV